MAIEIARIFHAGYQFECGDTKILFDPIFENPFSQNCYAFPSVEFGHEQIRRSSFSAVFISHFHDDHCSLESLNLLDRSIPIYLFCVFEDLFLSIKKLGFNNIFSLVLNESVYIGAFEIIPLRALDADVDCLFHIKVEDKNILNVVDSWIDEEIFQHLLLTPNWDLILWPFQLLQELQVLSPRRLKFEKEVSLPREWIDQIMKLQPKVIIPSSCQFKFEPWSWYNDVFFPISYQKFQNEIQKVAANIKVMRLNPAERIRLDYEVIKKTNSLPWILLRGKQNADYEYNPEVKPSPTAQIAQRFKKLTDVELDRVLKFCQIQLLEIFKLLDPREEVYFNKLRFWKLSLFSDTGSETTFHYQIRKTDISLADSGLGPLSWSTEIPIQKLFNALENGESLTSLYIRINDLIFDAETEKEISSADIMADPLLRCLYSGHFASYQKAQLARLGYK